MPPFAPVGSPAEPVSARAVAGEPLPADRAKVLSTRASIGFVGEPALKGCGNGYGDEDRGRAG